MSQTDDMSAVIAAEQAADEANASLARLAAEIVGLQRQVNKMTAEIVQSELRSTALTDAKFVTYRTLIDSQADKVKLALEATEKAIDKAEIATSKAIEKESESNNDRFAKVNEFRAQQTELIARFATLERVDLLYNQTRQRMEEIEHNMMGRLGDLADRVGDQETRIVASVNNLGTRLTSIEAATRGATGNMNKIYGAIAAAVGLIAIIVFIANGMVAR